MILVRLQTEDGRLVGIVEVLPFLTAPEVVMWGNRIFRLINLTPDLTYQECFAAVSFTTGERCAELTRTIQLLN